MLIISGDAGGHLAVAAEHASQEVLAFMGGEALGTARLALPAERFQALRLPEPNGHNGDNPATVALDAADARGATSPAGRLHTIRVAIAPDTNAVDLVQGGHVLAVRAEAGGVLSRGAPPEAAVDLVRLAGLEPAALICDINDSEGRPLRDRRLVEFGERHGLTSVSIDELVSWRRDQGVIVERVVTTELPTRFGRFSAVGYRSLDDGAHWLALVKGDVSGAEDALVSVHDQCLFGHALGSRLCSCETELESAMREIEREGLGVLLYLPDASGSVGPGLANRTLADLGVVSARRREVGGCGGLLQLGRSVSSIR